MIVELPGARNAPAVPSQPRPARPRVYIAGPITGSGTLGLNVLAAVGYWCQLWEAGFAPFCPHLGQLIEVLNPLDYEAWMEYDFTWLAQCEAVFRMPGVSPGADREELEAARLGIPVFKEVAEAVSWAKSRQA